MKAYIIDSVFDELKKIKKADLHGINNGSTTIVSSLTPKNGLSELGVFLKNKKHIIKTSQNQQSIFYFQDDQLHCLQNSDSEEPNIISVVDKIKYFTDFNKRNQGILDDTALTKKTVTIIGLGSGGSAIAVDLTKSGCTNFNLIDFDNVEVSNLCRSSYDLLDIGEKKTEASLNKMLSINPRANIRVFDDDILEMDSEIVLKIINTSDLIIEATDSFKTKIYINGLAHHLKPVIYPSVYDMGTGGDILFTKPGGPCYECLFSSMPEMKEIKKRDWDYTTGHAKPMAALLADIKVVVARSVKIALAILSIGSKMSFFEKVTEPDCTILFIGNEKGAFIFDSPFQEVWAKTSINPDCSCQTLS